MKVILLTFVLGIPVFTAGQQSAPVGELLQQFKANRVFWQQFQVAKRLVAAHDAVSLGQLDPYLKDEDRHVRGNAAFVFAALGDDRGFEVIVDILKDHSDRPKGQSVGGNWSVSSQIRSDRYYAAHLFGDLKDPRAVPLLIPLLQDPEISWIVPWSLGEIGDKSAIPSLIETLRDKSPDMRVLSIYALEKLRAKEALPQIRLMVDDEDRIHFDGLETVADTAKKAVNDLDKLP